jgi:hypothetical protein
MSEMSQSAHQGIPEVADLRPQADTTAKAHVGLLRADLFV